MKVGIVGLVLAAAVVTGIGLVPVAQAKPYWNSNPRPNDIYLVISAPLENWVVTNNQEVTAGVWATYYVSVFSFRGGKISLSVTAPPVWCAVLSKYSDVSRS